MKDHGLGLAGETPALDEAASLESIIADTAPHLRLPYPPGASAKRAGTTKI